MRIEQRHLVFSTIAGLTAPVVLAIALIPVRDTIGNANIALVLMAVVVAIATTGRRVAATVAAFSAAAAFDFFQTQPYYSFTIHRTEDIVSVALLAIAGLVVCQVALWGRGQRAHAERTLSEIAALRSIADMVASGESQTMVEITAAFWLRELLHLTDCRFETTVDTTATALIGPDGTVTMGELRWAPASQGLPAPEVHLPVRCHRETVGFFVLTPTPGAVVSEDRLYTAAAIADEVGAGHAHQSSS
jgi:K+-sensing histidine kinase KdpD